jgi:hypothetical protein
MNRMSTAIFLVAGTVALCVVTIGITNAWTSHRRYVQRLEREIAHYRDTFRTRVGFSSGIGNYNLISFDSGKHWFNRDDATPADPKVLEHIEGWYKLMEARDKNGAPLDPLNPEHRKVMEGAGFTVKVEREF